MANGPWISRRAADERGSPMNPHSDGVNALYTGLLWIVPYVAPQAFGTVVGRLIPPSYRWILSTVLVVCGWWAAVVWSRSTFDHNPGGDPTRPIYWLATFVAWPSTVYFAAVESLRVNRKRWCVLLWFAASFVANVSTGEVADALCDADVFQLEE